MTGLDLATDVELLAEVKKRFDAGVLTLMRNDGTRGVDQTVFFFGDFEVCLALSRGAVVALQEKGKEGESQA